MGRAVNSTRRRLRDCMVIAKAPNKRREKIMTDIVASQAHPHPSDVSFDGGDLDCGNGLLLLIRKHIDPMAKGQLLEILSTEISVEEDLPAWCRLTSNDLISFTKTGKQ